VNVLDFVFNKCPQAFVNEQTLYRLLNHLECAVSGLTGVLEWMKQKDLLDYKNVYFAFVYAAQNCDIMVLDWLWDSGYQPLLDVTWYAAF
jgi:hypothetical protein